jgi:hypothetical protein
MWKRILVLLSIFVTNPAAAETVNENPSFDCVAVEGITYYSNDAFRTNAIAGSGDQKTTATKDGSLSITGLTGQLIGEFTLSQEQTGQAVDDLMKACRKKLGHVHRRTPELTAAFDGEGLTCSKGESVMLADGSDQSEIPLSLVTDFAKAEGVPDILKIAIGAEYHDFTLSPRQSGLSIDQLLIGCSLMADVRHPPLSQQPSG